MYLPYIVNTIYKQPETKGEIHSGSASKINEKCGGEIKKRRYLVFLESGPYPGSSTTESRLQNNCEGKMCGSKEKGKNGAT